MNEYKIDSEGRECTICKKYKLWIFFARDRSGTGGHNTRCKECIKVYKHVYHRRPEVKARSKVRAQQPEDKARAKARRQQPEVKARTNARRREYFQRPEVKARINARDRAHYQRPEVKARVLAYMQQPEVKARTKTRTQQPRVKKRAKEYQRIRRQCPAVKRQEKDYRQQPKVKKRRAKKERDRRKHPPCRLSRNMSTAVGNSLRSDKAGCHWETLVGYTLKKLQTHLASQFEPGMTWDNYGKEWHIDHIKPKFSFTFETAEDEEFKKCWALSNLMPRWATTEIARKHGSSQIGNLNKHARILNA